MEDKLKPESLGSFRTARRRSYSTTFLEESAIRNEQYNEGYNRRTSSEISELAHKANLMSHFVPQKLLAIFHQPQYNNDSLIRETVYGALMVADISGFTKLSEEYAAMGVEGIEEVSRHVNQYFSQLIHIIEYFGGDIMYFAGDAIFVLFNFSKQQFEKGINKAVGVATLNAIRCAFHVKNSPLGSYRDFGVRLSLHLAISAGQMSFFVVGKTKRAYLLYGPPVQEIGQILPLSKTSDVVVTCSAWELLSEYLQSIPNEQPVPLVSALTLPEDCGLKILSVYDQSPTEPLKKVTAYSYLYSNLIPFVPLIVKDRIEANQIPLLGVLCTATVIFISPQIDVSNINAETQDKIHQFYVLASNFIQRFEGTVRQFCIDDKGITFIAAFSIRPFVHEDDPFRSVTISLELYETLKELGVKTTFGIATGKVFCGKVGSEERHEFGILGDTVNLAARLCFSKQNESILCDKNTYIATKDLFKFREHGILIFKGRNPAEAYIPIAFASGELLHSPRSSRKYSTRLIGREPELSMIQSCKAKTKQSCQVFLLEGKPGEGKSALLDHILQTSGHFVCVKASVLEINKSEELLIWKTIIEKLIMEYPKNSSLALDLQIRQNKFLQNVVNHSPIPSLINRSRSASIFERTLNPESLLDLLKKLVSSRPTIIILDNCHWLDSTSWGIFDSLINTPLPLLFVLSYRPDVSLESTIENLTKNGAIHHVLPPLDPYSSERLLCAHWKVNLIPPIIVESIYLKSKGTPLFILELANYVLQTNQIILKDDKCQLASSNLRLKFPDSLSQLIGSIISKLHPRLQTCCHVASVIGTTFSLQFLKQIYPLKVTLEELREMIQELVRHRILQPINLATLETPNGSISVESSPSTYPTYSTSSQRVPRRCMSYSDSTSPNSSSVNSTPNSRPPSIDESFEFVNSCLQEAAYEFLPFELRRELHSKIADSIENNSDIYLYAYHLSRTLNFHSPPAREHYRNVSDPSPCVKNRMQSPFANVRFKEKKGNFEFHEYPPTSSKSKKYLQFLSPNFRNFKDGLQLSLVEKPDS